MSILVLYGSQTGNAEEISKDIAENIRNENAIIDVSLQEANAFIKREENIEKLNDYTGVVLIMSTTGQGDPPDNARRFLRMLKNCKGSLADTRYAILALGDTNYTNFCAPGKLAEKYFNKHGATAFHKIALADDGVGLDVVVEPFKNTIGASASKLIAESASHGASAAVAVEAVPVVEEKNDSVAKAAYEDARKVSESLMEVDFDDFLQLSDEELEEVLKEDQVKVLKRLPLRRLLKDNRTE